MLFSLEHIPRDNSKDFHIKIDCTVISRVKTPKYLEVIIDEKLKWQNHIVAIKLAKSLGILNRLKYKLPKSCMLTLYFSVVCPYLTCCNIVWRGASKS